MTCEKKDENFLSFSYREKMRFEKFNCFSVDFLSYSFRRIKAISTVVERQYTPDITGFYMIGGFTELYYLKLFRQSTCIKYLR